jgi:NAD(P)-dependent dehydrogenase (short-subunit alcohol dehydrogenase family)
MGMAEVPLALVTGASQRLGRAFALSLARRGNAILVHYHDSRRMAEATVDEIRSLGVPAYLAQADLANPDELRTVIGMLDRLDHPLRILVNSAAIMPRQDLRSMTVEGWDRTFDINLRAPLFLSQLAAERMTRGGLVVNVTDAGAGKLWTGYPAYQVSKAALEVLTRLLAKTYAPGVRVNAIAPGLVLAPEGFNQEEWQKLVQRLPMERAVTPEEVVAALEFLMENEAVTGQTILVDGGYSLI